MTLYPDRVIHHVGRAPVYVYAPPQTDQLATLTTCHLCQQPMGTDATLASILHRDGRAVVHLACLSPDA